MSLGVSVVGESLGVSVVGESLGVSGPYECGGCVTGCEWSIQVWWVCHWV